MRDKQDLIDKLEDNLSIYLDDARLLPPNISYEIFEIIEDTINSH